MGRRRGEGSSGLFLVSDKITNVPLVTRSPGRLFFVITKPPKSIKFFRDLGLHAPLTTVADGALSPAFAFILDDAKSCHGFGVFLLG